MFARAMQADHQILFAIIGAADVEITVGKSGVAESLRHGFGGRTDIADRVGGIDFDELFEDVMRELPGLVVDLSGGDKRKKEDWGQEKTMVQPGSPFGRCSQYQMNAAGAKLSSTS